MPSEATAFAGGHDTGRSRMVAIAALVASIALTMLAAFAPVTWFAPEGVAVTYGDLLDLDAIGRGGLREVWLLALFWIPLGLGVLLSVLALSPQAWGRRVAQVVLAVLAIAMLGGVIYNIVFHLGNEDWTSAQRQENILEVVIMGAIVFAFLGLLWWVQRRGRAVGLNIMTVVLAVIALIAQVLSIVSLLSDGSQLSIGPWLPTISFTLLAVAGAILVKANTRDRQSRGDNVTEQRQRR